MCGIRWLRQLVAELLHLRAERSPVAGANRFQRAVSEYSGFGTARCQRILKVLLRRLAAYSGRINWACRSRATMYRRTLTYRPQGGRPPCVCDTSREITGEVA